jgi:hypothetical protein
MAGSRGNPECAACDGDCPLSKAQMIGVTTSDAAATPRFRSITSLPSRGQFLARYWSALGSASLRVQRVFLKKARLTPTTVTQQSPTDADEIQAARVQEKPQAG